jgi:hypothetical protein
MEATAMFESGYAENLLKVTALVID